LTCQNRLIVGSGLRSILILLLFQGCGAVNNGNESVSNGKVSGVNFGGSPFGQKTLSMLDSLVSKIEWYGDSQVGSDYNLGWSGFLYKGFF
jgi:hypothetical protein